mgnify:CR=1 FL=1
MTAKKQKAAAAEAPRARNSADVIVLGGGHNGLVAAAYLARAGILAIFEANYQNLRMVTKTCFGSFLPKHVLVAKSFGHSTIFTDSSVAAAKTCFGCQSFFLAAKSGFGSRLPTRKFIWTLVDTMFHN